MKLELKHLAPYKPYMLKYEYSGNIYLFNSSIGDLTIGYDDNQDSWHPISMVKPILRTLSDLTKEIEHNERSFIPLAEIFLIHPKASFDYEDSKTNIKCWDNVKRSDGKDFECGTFYLPPIVHHNEYGSVEKLFEWHFDVFGLIEKGLAIDINHLNKQ